MALILVALNSGPIWIARLTNKLHNVSTAISSVLRMSVSSRLSCETSFTSYSWWRCTHSFVYWRTRYETALTLVDAIT